MSEGVEQSERSPKDPVRIVYHAENKTFARLFNERSLEQLKDVVRRKLGLGQETEVSLKQMGPDALLDLEDDDDFQAFRVLLRTSISVDIQVTVGRSHGSPVPPPVVPQPREQPAVAEPPITSSPPKKSVGSATVDQSTPRPEVTTTKKTSGPSARKRKVSFGDAAVETPDEPAERHAQSKTVADAPVSSAKTAETPKPVGAEEPPKKRQRKEVVKAKDIQPAEDVGSPSAKASSTPKTKGRKSAALVRGSEAETSAPKDADVPEPPATKPRKRKTDENTVLKRSFPPASSEGMDQSISQTGNSVNGTSLQLASTKSRAGRSVSKTRQAETIGVCATIPRTGESASVQSEVTTAILSHCLSNPGEIILPAPRAKRKYVKKATKISAASSNTSLAKSTTVLHAPASGIPNALTEHRPERVAPTNEPPPQARDLEGPPCPICLQEPFHIRYRCPTVLKGPNAIRERLEEVRRTNVGDQQCLIKELEGLLRESEVASGPLLHDVQSQEVSPPLIPSASRTLNIPSNSTLSEVTVESREEGSSSDSSDDISEESIEHNKELSALGKQKMPDKQPLPPNDDLEAIVRGPALKRQSILGVLDRIVGREDDKSSDSEEDENGLEEDQDEEIDRSRRRLSKHITHSSDSESEEGESRSSSPLRPATDNPKSGVQGSNNPGEEFTERQDGDVVMRDCVGPLENGEQDDDTSEETHVGSEDRMVVDDPNRKKGATAIVEEQLPSDAPSNKPRESEQSKVDPASNQDGVASKIPNEAEADPIESADDLEPPATSRSSNVEPIEAPPEDIGSFFTSASQSTSNPGVTRRIKTRNGQILDDEAERPVLLEQLTTEATPLPTKGSRRKATEMSASQEPASTRKSPRFSSAPPPTSTPVAVAILNHKSKVGARSVKAAKTPAKRSTGASQSSAKDGNTQNRVRIAAAPSLIEWETLAEPSSSPSLQLDEPSVHVDELMSSPQPAVIPIRGRPNVKKTRGRLQKPEVESSQEGERLFDLSSSQIPFPYSQRKINPAPAAFLNGKEEKEVATDSEEEVTLTKKRAEIPARYRSLSQLATDATFFSPSLPTPTTKPMSHGKKKPAADEDSSSSSTSSDEDEANRSEHIPRGQRAASVLETRKKKGILSRA